MAFARWERPIQDGAGNLIADVWCEVRREDVAGNPKATLYSDRAGASVLANPFMATDGIPAFHAAGGSYRVRIYKAGYDETFRYQAVGTGAEIDADTLLIPGYLFEFEGETSAPPGEGGIRADNVALGSATRLWIDKETVAGIDVSARIAALDGKRILLTSTNAGEQVSWDVDLVTDEGGYFELVLSAHSGAASIVAGRCGMQPEPSQGPAGLDGLFSGEEVELTGASETLITAHRGETIILNRATAMALAAQPAATLGAEWAVMVMNIGAGTVTLDPDGAETVNGAATLAIPPGTSFILSCNGTTLKTSMWSSPVISAPTLTLKASTTPTPTAEGQIEWDSDDDTLVVGGGAQPVVFRSAFPGYLFGLGTANNASDATNDIDIAAGMAADSTGKVMLVLASAMTKRLDATWAAGSGNGGRFSGVSLSNTTYHVFLIGNPTTGAVDVGYDTSAIAANRPAGYTLFRRIAPIMRASSAIVPYTQVGDLFTLATPVRDLNQNAPGTSALTVTLSVPTGIAVEARGVAYAQVTAGSSTFYIYVSALTSTDVAASATALTATFDGEVSGGMPGYFSTMTNTSGQVRYRQSNGGSDYTANVITLGWVDTRNRLAA